MRLLIRAQLSSTKPRTTMAHEQAREEVVYCCDVGTVFVGAHNNVLDRSSFAWARCDDPDLDQPSENANWNDPEALAASIARDINKGCRVALGIEAPMWLPVIDHLVRESAPWALFRPRMAIESELRASWYLQLAAPASVRAPQLVFLALSKAADQADLRLTVNVDQWRTSPDNESILVWEGFAVGGFKPNYGEYENENQDLLDAWCLSRMFQGLLRDGVPQENPMVGPVLSGADQQGFAQVSLWAVAARLLALDADDVEARCLVIGTEGCTWPISG